MLGKVVIVGGGKMGEVIVNGIISNHLALPANKKINPNVHATKPKTLFM